MLWQADDSIAPTRRGNGRRQNRKRVLPLNLDLTWKRTREANPGD